MENAKVENSCQKRCPKCGALPREYKLRGQCPLGGSHVFTPEGLWDLIFSPLHVGLRGVDGLIRLACLLYIDHPTCTQHHLDRYNDFMTQIQQAYLNRPGHSKLYIKFVTPDGGDTINGFICIAILIILVPIQYLTYLAICVSRLVPSSGFGLFFNLFVQLVGLTFS